MKLRDVSGMPVMPKRCRTCPFNDNGCIEVRNAVIGRTLQGINQTCHHTGALHGKEDTHLCCGAHEFQRMLFYLLGVLKEPTDAAWDEALAEIRAQKGKAP